MHAIKGWGQVIIGVADAGAEISTRPFQLVTGRPVEGLGVRRRARPHRRAEDRRLVHGRQDQHRLPMRFSVFLPARRRPAMPRQHVPAIVYLAGLTCNEETS